MQAQATGSRRFGFNRLTLVALAIGILAIATALVINDTVDLPFTSESQEVTERPFDRLAGYKRIGYLEQNIWDVVPAGPNIAATAVHPDTYPDDYVD